MKAILSFIISIAIYLGIGLIAWNIVYSLIDLNSVTVVALSNYRLCTYSAVTLLCFYILPFLIGTNTNDDVEGYYIGVTMIIGINLLVMIAINSWEDAWESVSTIVSIVYNLINIGYMAITIYSTLKHKAK